MPTYDFRCADCGHKFTVLVSISEKDKVTCPACSSKEVQQLITGCAVRTGGGACDLPAPGGGYAGGG
ncbi:FmdB family zinc ribbon protein [Desulfoscipio geothermicus]|uniref:Putative regulatory protein, FmdB family n=1 Tax=Desulfoscipio geothermicus DSM 3669 TaxID=1121426 RepID=A0A1I6DBU6_9FIRM|nr:zinc ribbon domain-containing protein [Desulfoscipio geothermicus]SFR02914.1 putative regulatory protein, FmdB family [Desulfoscipio geothermicus DSM 3669]